MTFDLQGLLDICIKTAIKNESVASQTGILSGSNALLFDGNRFEAESSDNCPRVALLRRTAGIQGERSAKSFISNSHGRTFEDFLRKLLDTGDIEYEEEEAVQVNIENVLTARPDKIIRVDGKKYPIETKTIQSNTTAYSVFIKEKPKLGALAQLAIYMNGHNLDTGFLLYCASNWFTGFAGKKRWKVEPSFKVFKVELVDDDLFYNGVKSLLSMKKIIGGAYEYISCRDKNTLPERPDWRDINGDAASYSGCDYCFARDNCDTFDWAQDKNLDKFFRSFREKDANII